MTPAIGMTVDRRYLLKREIARGGSGAVFEAEHLYTRRAVALKLLLPAQRQVVELRTRLLHEALALSAARHPGIVAALDAGETDDGTPYLVLELLEGRSLDGILAVRRKLGSTEVAWIGISLCEALGSAHRREILHRDIKPSNVFIARNEQGQEVVKLFDFGVARVPTDDKKTTQHGTLLGTPEYMAPEQLLAHELDVRADLYALGITLYECLAGTVPFEGNYGEVLLKVSTETLPPLRDKVPDVSAALAAAIERALCRDRNDRYRDADSFADALRQAAPAVVPGSILGIRQGPVPTRHAIGAPVCAVAPERAPNEATRGAPQDVSQSSPESAPGPLTRRRFARAPYVTPVRVSHAGAQFDGRSEDVSVGGLLVLGPQLFEQATLVQVRFALPMTGQVIDVEAMARWVKAAGHRGAVGLEFLSLPSSAHKVIERYVALMGGE